MAFMNGPLQSILALFLYMKECMDNTYLAPKMSFLARSMPDTTFTLRIRDSSC